MILGVDFGGTKVAIGLADRTGRVLMRRRLDTDAAAGADQAVDRTLLAAGEMLAESATQLIAIGVVSPGIVLPDRILLAPNVPGWERLRLRETVSNRMGGMPTVVGTDAKAAALAEWRWGALTGADAGLFLSVGTGVDRHWWAGAGRQQRRGRRDRLQPARRRRSAGVRRGLGAAGGGRWRAGAG
jgi:glucokinase